MNVQLYELTSVYISPCRRLSFVWDLKSGTHKTCGISIFPGNSFMSTFRWLISRGQGRPSEESVDSCWWLYMLPAHTGQIAAAVEFVLCTNRWLVLFANIHSSEQLHVNKASDRSWTQPVCIRDSAFLQANWSQLISQLLWGHIRVLLHPEAAFSHLWTLANYPLLFGRLNVSLQMTCQLRVSSSLFRILYITKQPASMATSTSELLAAKTDHHRVNPIIRFIRQ